MTAAERLDAIEALADAADRGPWQFIGETSEICMPDGGIAEMTWPRHVVANATFIAAARTDVPALVAALRAVLDLTLAARMHPGSLRAFFAEDIEAAITTALDGAS